MNLKAAAEEEEGGKEGRGVIRVDLHYSCLLDLSKKCKYRGVIAQSWRWVYATISQS